MKDDESQASQVSHGGASADDETSLSESDLASDTSEVSTKTSEKPADEAADADSDIPDLKVDKENQRIYLSALFSVAGMFSKITSTNILFTNKAVYHFRQVRVLGKRWKMEDFDECIQVCQDMEQLLPIKYARGLN